MQKRDLYTDGSVGLWCGCGSFLVALPTDDPTLVSRSAKEIVRKRYSPDLRDDGSVAREYRVYSIKLTSTIYIDDSYMFPEVEL